MTEARERTYHGPVRLQDIADRCGVSRSTVSRVLRGDGHHASPETVNLIQQAAVELGYDPSVYHAARRLVLSRRGETPLNHIVAMIHGPKPASAVYSVPYYFRMLMGVADGLSSRGFAILEFFVDKHELGPAERIFARGDVDGAITTWEPDTFVPVLNKLRALPLFGSRPVVALIQPSPACSAVLADDEAGGYQVASHLLDLGHRHLLLLWVEEARFEYCHGQREAGCRRACLERGLDPDAHVHFLDWDSEKEEQRDNLVPYLREHPEITAIFASNDPAAAVVHEVLASMGRRVPQDYSLVGFDDAPFPGRSVPHSLTTVRVPLELMGRRAAILTVERLTGVESEDQTVMLPVELVVRSTTAPPRCG